MKRETRSSAILLLLDGLGIGRREPSQNPLAAFQPRVLRIFEDGLGPFPRHGRAFRTEVGLGVPGRPQSATNHTALLTGVNAPQLLGRHLTGYPNRRLRELLAEKSLFRRMKERGLGPAFANAYRDEFFTQRPRWVSATTVMCETSGTPFFRMPDLIAGRTLSFDFTNRLLRERGYQVPERTPAQAAQILVELTREHDLVLYEYFLTDLAGHRGKFAEAVRVLRALDTFLAELVERLPPETSLIVTSDHGNIEDKSHGRHTQTDVATMCWGSFLPDVDGESFSLTALCPLLVGHFREHR